MPMRVIGEPCHHDYMAGIGSIAGRTVWTTALALSCSCVLWPAWAAPPLARPVARAASQLPHLDLRPPSVHEMHGLGGSRAGTMERPSWDGSPGTMGSRDSTLPALGGRVGETRVMSRAEAFARRLHREGLPLARLWENHSALVSLGLNPKGKPGLWLVQKTH
jgi:hypothetical protein